MTPRPSSRSTVATRHSSAKASDLIVRCLENVVSSTRRRALSCEDMDLSWKQVVKPHCTRSNLACSLHTDTSIHDCTRCSRQSSVLGVRARPDEIAPDSANDTDCAARLMQRSRKIRRLHCASRDHCRDLMHELDGSSPARSCFVDNLRTRHSTSDDRASCTLRCGPTRAVPPEACERTTAVLSRLGRRLS